MKNWLSVAALVLIAASPTLAATIEVPAGGNLQTALDAARPGDTIQLAAGATYTGNFVLPLHGGTTYVTITTADAGGLLPPAGTRITPAHAPYLARIQSPNTSPAMRVQPGAGFWRIQLVEFLPTSKGYYDILSLGDGSSAQNTMDKVPHHLIVDRVYLHGDRVMGQKRGIALNSAYTTIVNSHVSDIKAAGQDSQAIGGWNGPGPYHVENNYLEAAGDVILIGGDDPKIPGLIATNLTFRGNTMTRPVRWRDPIVPTPDGLRASAVPGSLPAGTYGYRVAARQNIGSSGTATSTPAAEVQITVPGGTGALLSWSPVPDAIDYVVYGRTPGGQTVYWVTTATSFTDDGVIATKAGTPPSKGTVWSVKNIFELKNARQVQVDYNLMENNWQNAQSGVAVLFTVRNQYGSCTWCVVEDVTFEHNVVRHTGGTMTVLGIDNNYPSQQTNRIRIRNNEFSDYSKFWGGTGYGIMLDGQPRDVTIDHNTFIAGNGAGMLLLSGPPITGLDITNNVARHDTYGIMGSGKGYGTGALSYYAPDGVFLKNVLAGGKASMYPAGNLFPTVTDFAAHFMSYDNADFRLVPGTDWERAGTDGLDLGAAMNALGSPSTSTPEPPAILTTSLPDGVEGAGYSASLQASGGRAPYAWSVYTGTLPAGLMLDPLNGTLTGAPVSPGDATFTVQLRDGDGATARQPLSIHVEPAIPPVVVMTSVLPAATATVPYSAVLDATGGHGTYVWTLNGALPQGLTLNPAGTISGTPTTSGTFTIAVTASDAVDASRFASGALTLSVAPPPNIAPTVGLVASQGTVSVGQAVTFTASPFDPDGYITRVDFVIDGTVVRSVQPGQGSGGQVYTYAWTATAGSHVASAYAVDNRGGAGWSTVLSIATLSEVVLRATDVKTMVGNYKLVVDKTAADGVALYNPNTWAPKVAASAAPANYVEFEFYAEAGRPYHIWIRGKAKSNEFGNDSAFLQFSNVARAKIGTTSSVTYQLEDAPAAGVDGWGWQDNDLGTVPNQFGTSIVFDVSGLQKLRIQQREDGLYIDQIVISPERFLLVAPGVLRRDTTILPR